MLYVQLPGLFPFKVLTMKNIASTTYLDIFYFKPATKPPMNTHSSLSNIHSKKSCPAVVFCLRYLITISICQLIMVFTIQYTHPVFICILLSYNFPLWIRGSGIMSII